MLLMMSVQLISLTIPVLATSGSDILASGVDAEYSLMSSEGSTQQSHSSPFYFPVQSSSPLFVDELDDDRSTDVDQEQEETLQPQAADYYTNSESVLTVYLEKSALIPEEDVQMHFRLTNNLTAVANAPIQLR